MSSSIGAIGATVSSYELPDASETAKQPAKLSESQQMQQLEHAGQSAKQIATTLGLPETLVDEALGITSAATAAVTSIPGKLSIQA